MEPALERGNVKSGSESCMKINEKIDSIHFTCSVKCFVVTNLINLVYLVIKSVSH